MSYFVACDPTRGTFTDITFVPLVSSGSPGVYALPSNGKCIASPLLGYQFAGWMGAYVVNQTGSMLEVINWFGGNYVQALFTPAWQYNWDITNGTGPFTTDVQSGSYPPGLIPNESGTTTKGNLIQSGTFPISVKVTDSVGATASVSCDIEVPLIEMQCNNPPNAFIGLEYNHGLTASGGNAPYSFTLISGDLPPGLRIDPITGIIAGTPLQV